MAYFVCPNCLDRSLDSDGREGLSHQSVGCRRCGFGFLFEVLDDYYPRPDSAAVACDKQGRVLAAGRGTFELTGYREGDLMGRPVVDALGLHAFGDGRDPIATALEWGVRQLDQPAELRHAVGHAKRVICDIFPALDDDGGLLVVVAPRIG